jgi:hypothetical protein
MDRRFKDCVNLYAKKFKISAKMQIKNKNIKTSEVGTNPYGHFSNFGRDDICQNSKAIFFQLPKRSFLSSEVGTIDI